MFGGNHGSGAALISWPQIQHVNAKIVVLAYLMTTNLTRQWFGNHRSGAAWFSGKQDEATEYKRGETVRRRCCGGVQLRWVVWRDGVRWWSDCWLGEAWWVLISDFVVVVTRDGGGVVINWLGFCGGRQRRSSVVWWSCCCRDGGEAKGLVDACDLSVYSRYMQILTCVSRQLLWYIL